MSIKTLEISKSSNIISSYIPILSWLLCYDRSRLSIDTITGLTLWGLVVLEGMVIGLVASLLFVVFKSSWPHLSSLGCIPSTPGAYSDLTRYLENTLVSGIIILRLDVPIYYANALTVRDRAKALIAQAQLALRGVVLDSIR
jgi:MFS superfamily sulfate permease-like transporter